MFSAISFGVFCRLAPSTRAIIRSMKVSPGLEVILTTIRSDSTVVPPVTADRSPPDSRMTGADSPVMADSSTEATPSTTSPSPGMTWPGLDHHVVAELQRRASYGLLAQRGRLRPRLPVEQPPGHRLALGPAQRLGLGLAAALGHRLGQVGEHHGQPEPDHDGPVEHRRRLDRRVQGQHGADLDHEHDRVLDLDPRVQLLERVRGRLPQDLRVEQAAADPARLGRRPAWRRPGPGSPGLSVVTDIQCSPSANGPSASAGK